MEDRSALNAVTLALIDAGLPMRDFVTACEAGYIDGHVLVDPNALEAAGAFPLSLCAACCASVYRFCPSPARSRAPVGIHGAGHARRHSAPACVSPFGPRPPVRTAPLCPWAPVGLKAEASDASPPRLTPRLLVCPTAALLVCTCASWHVRVRQFVHARLCPGTGGGEGAARGPELCVAHLPNLQEICSTHLDGKLPLEALNQVSRVLLCAHQVCEG